MKRKIFLGFIIIIAILGLSTVKADNEEEMYELMNEPMTESLDMVEGSEEALKASEDSEKSIVNKNVYDANNEVKAESKIINGNEYLFANHVSIENQEINGDLFIFGNNIKIDEKSVINGNVFICGSNITFNGNVTRDLYVAGQYVDIGKTAVVGYGLNVGSEILKISGTVERDVNAAANELEITEDAKINGDLNYSSTEEGKIASDVVKGKVNFDKQIVKDKTTSDIIYGYCKSLVRNVIFVEVVFILLIMIAPKSVDSLKKYLGKNTLKAVGVGLASLILIPLCMLICMVLNITLNVGLILIPCYIVLIAISESIFVIALSNKLLDKFSKIKLPVMVPIVTVLLWILKQVPYINSFVIFFTILIGFGIIIQSLFSKKNV